MLVKQSTSIPIRPRVSTGPLIEPVQVQSGDGLLMVGHGSHCFSSVAQMQTLAKVVDDSLPEVLVGLGFLEMSQPPAGAVLDEMVAGGCRRIVILPMMLLAAGHAKSDVPAIVVEARLRHPQVEIFYGSPFGVVPELVEIAASNVSQAGGDGLPLLVVARGTSDPDANGDAFKAGRLVAEWSSDGDTPFQMGFTGVTGPLVPEALELMGTLGYEKFSIFFWFLCNGKLIERARYQVASFLEESSIEVVDAGYFGPDPKLVEVILARYSQALDGVASVNCDTCAYRAPFPGFEDKVGQAVGVGHSHLAVDHRGSHHDHDHHGHSHQPVING